MLRNILILVFILGTSCKSQMDINSSDMSASNSSTRNNIIFHIMNCSNDFHLVDINEYIQIKIQPSLCNIFEEFIVQNKIVFLNLRGYFINRKFSLNDGHFLILESINHSENNLKIIDGQTLDFTNFGFIIDEEAFKKSIVYRISDTKFEIINKNQDKLPNEQYELRIIIISPAPR